MLLHDCLLQNGKKHHYVQKNPQSIYPYMNSQHVRRMTNKHKHNLSYNFEYLSKVHLYHAATLSDDHRFGHLSELQSYYNQF